MIGVDTNLLVRLFVPVEPQRETALAFFAKRSPADPARTQTPHRLRCSFRGVVPPKADGALLFSMIGWGVGSIILFTRYGSDQLECTIGRGDQTEGGFFSTAMRLRSSAAVSITRPFGSRGVCVKRIERH